MGGSIKERRKIAQGLSQSIFKNADKYGQITVAELDSVQGIAGKAAAVLYMAILQKMQDKNAPRPHSSDFAKDPEKAKILQEYENEVDEHGLFYFTNEDAQRRRIKNLYRTMHRLEKLGFIDVIWRAPKYWTRQDGSTISARNGHLKTPRTIYALSERWTENEFLLLLPELDKREAVSKILEKQL